MPLLRVNATASGLRLHDTSFEASFRLCDKTLCPGPAIIMLHGYKYAPATAVHCPHEKIFGPAPNGWPAKLGFGSDDSAEGVGIAMGWYARGSLNKVHRRARGLGSQLARIVSMLRDQSPERPVHVLAHSLGVELALSALPHLPIQSIDRMVFLTGASYQSRAHEMLATEAGRSTEVLNVVSRENDLFDAAFERLVPTCRAEDCAIGQGVYPSNAVNLQIDCARSIAALNGLSPHISSVSKRVCHWSAYRRKGLMALYASFLRHPEDMPLDRLSALLPQVPAPRWSRLMPEITERRQPEAGRLHRRLYELASQRRRITAAFAGKARNEHAN